MERAGLRVPLALTQHWPELKRSSYIQAVALMSMERNGAGPDLLSKLPTAKLKVVS